MIENADKVVVLADHSKIDKKAMCHVCDLEKIDILVTDVWPENKDILKKYEKVKIQIIQT